MTRLTTTSFTMVPATALVFILIASVSLVPPTTAAPAIVSTNLTPNFLSRGLFDVFSSKTSVSPTPLPSSGGNSDTTDDTSGTGNSDETVTEPEVKTPEPTTVEIIATPTPLELPLSEPTPTPYVGPVESSSPSFTPQPLEAGADGSDVDNKDDPSNPRSNPDGDTDVPSAAAGGVPVIALVVVAAVILVPVILIYVGIRRRRDAGFENMPPTEQAHTYSGENPRTNFSVGDD